MNPITAARKSDRPVPHTRTVSIACAGARTGKLAGADRKRSALRLCLPAAGRLGAHGRRRPASGRGRTAGGPRRPDGPRDRSGRSTAQVRRRRTVARRRPVHPSHRPPPAVLRTRPARPARPARRHGTRGARNDARPFARRRSGVRGGLAPRGARRRRRRVRRRRRSFHDRRDDRGPRAGDPRHGAVPGVRGAPAPPAPGTAAVRAPPPLRGGFPAAGTPLVPGAGGGRTPPPPGGAHPLPSPARPSPPRSGPTADVLGGHGTPPRGWFATRPVRHRTRRNPARSTWGSHR